MYSGNPNVNPNSWTEYVSVALFIAILSVGFFYAVSVTANMPDVHVSHSTNECVEVINYTEEKLFSCENMPTKYNKVWVK
tara:strand:- start:2904 stop:3143 length:240 start_codon:yes stop_codon:yes gene_type:complete